MRQYQEGAWAGEQTSGFGPRIGLPVKQRRWPRVSTTLKRKTVHIVGGAMVGAAQRWDMESLDKGEPLCFRRRSYMEVGRQNSVGVPLSGHLWPLRDSIIAEESRGFRVQNIWV